MVQIESKDDEKRGNREGERKRQRLNDGGGRCSLACTRARKRILSLSKPKSHSFKSQSPRVAWSRCPWLSGARERERGTIIGPKTKDHRGCRNLIITGKGGRRKGNSASSSMNRMESLDQLPVIVSNTSEFRVQCHPRIISSSTRGSWSSHVWGGTRCSLSLSHTLTAQPLRAQVRPV